MFRFRRGRYNGSFQGKSTAYLAAIGHFAANVPLSAFVVGTTKMFTNSMRR